MQASYALKAKLTVWRFLSWLTLQLSYLIGEPVYRLKGRQGKGQKIDISQVKRVLVVRLDEFGDLVMNTSFLRELRQMLPEAWITLVVKKSLYSIVELCPYVDEVLTFDSKPNKYFQPLVDYWRAWQLGRTQLWAHQFDLAILPRWNAYEGHGNFLAYYSGARWRVGYSEKVLGHPDALNAGCDRLLTHILTDKTIKHSVEQNLDVIRFLGGTVQLEQLELWLAPEDEAFAQQLLSDNGVAANDLLIAFCPGAAAAKRIWPLTNFVEVGAWLIREYQARIVVFGGKGEESLGEELQRQLGDRVLNTVGRTNLRQAGALMKHCRLYVGNDTGPMHLAAAAPMSVIELSCHPIGGTPEHNNSPKRFGPSGVPNRVVQPSQPQAPCTDGCEAYQAHCILGITVEQVKHAVVELLSQPDSPRSKLGELEHAG